jgi:long-subunit fatty acid transport protein
MHVRQLCVLGVLVVAPPAIAGGLFVPGTGVVSTSRAGAAVASVDDGEALGINPAGLAKAEGLKITISSTFIRYYMSFTRRGRYDPITLEDRPYEGERYETIENDPKPPLGIGTYQPLPVIAVTSDLGGRVPGLTIGAGLYTPTGYPFRDMTNGYQFQTDPGADYSTAPPPTRYDVMTQESAMLMPSVAAAYRVLPELDVGARFTAGSLKSKTQVVVWGTPGNVEEDIKKDALFTADVKDSFVPSFGLGATYRVGPSIELGAAWTSPVVIRAKGTAVSLRGPSVDMSRIIGPRPDNEALCDTGGTFEAQKACISLQLPMTATVGGRYKILDDAGKLKADLELNVNWENWGKRCDFSDAKIADSDCTSPGQYRVQIDSGLYIADANGNPQYVQPLNTTGGANVVNLGLRDTFSFRLGGSYHHPVADNRIIVRGGVAYDTAAAKTGWLRTNFDGAARLTSALGGAFDAGSWQVNAGFGYVHEGSNRNPGANPDGTDCNPTEADFFCAGGAPRPPADRQGPDPTNPLLTPDTQFENPYNQGTIRSRYLMFMMGFTKSW